MEYLRSPQELPENLRFISVEEIESMRHEQELLVTQAAVDALEGKSAFEIVAEHEALIGNASNAMREQIDQAAELYVAEHLSRDDNHELFDGCVELVRRYSVLNMTDEQWRAGEKDDDGRYTQPETSGQSALKAELLALIEADPAVDIDPVIDIDPDASSRELDLLQTSLTETRSRLADISMKRRAMVRKSGKKARDLETQYALAQEAYSQAYIAMGQFGVDALRASGASNAEVAQAVIRGTVTERAAFTDAEAEVMAEDNRFSTKMLRLYGKLPIMIGANSVVGFTLGAGVRKAVRLGFIAAMPVAGVAGLLGVRAGKALLTSSVVNRVRLHKEHDKRALQDVEGLRAQFDSQDVNVQGNGAIGSEYYANLSQQLLQQSIDQRVSRDVKANRNRTMLSATIAGGAAVIGSMVAHGSMRLPDWVADNKGGDLNNALPKPGVDDSIYRDQIMANPDAFYRMINDPQSFTKFLETVEHIRNTTGLSGKALEDRVHKTLELANKLEDHPRASGMASDVLKNLPVIDG